MFDIKKTMFGCFKQRRQSLAYQEDIPTLKINIGDQAFGGYYVGSIVEDSKNIRHIICSGREGNSDDELRWKTEQTPSPNTSSFVDGRINTYAMSLDLNFEEYEHPAANFCRNLRLNDFDDWYLPSIQELSLVYASNEILREKNVGLWSLYYWSSTETHNTECPHEFVNQAWYMYMVRGERPKTMTKTFPLNVRAIRSVTIDISPFFTIFSYGRPIP